MAQLPNMMSQPQQVTTPQPVISSAQGAGGPGQAPPSHDLKMDSISKVKSLIWPLKESLATCMRVAASNISHNAAVDAGAKGADQQPPRFDKCLEDFYAICDQVELNLKVALDCSNLATASQRYTPFAVVTNKPDINMPESHSYNQLISVVKMQVDHAKEIHEYLTNAASTISNSEKNEIKRFSREFSAVAITIVATVGLIQILGLKFYNLQ